MPAKASMTTAVRRDATLSGCEGSRVGLAEVLRPEYGLSMTPTAHSSSRPRLAATPGEFFMQVRDVLAHLGSRASWS